MCGMVEMMEYLTILEGISTNGGRGSPLVRRPVGRAYRRDNVG